MSIAGAYLDGEPLDELGARTLDLTVDIASGTPSVGERAGHHQVQIWRDWQQTRPANVAILERKSYSGQTHRHSPPPTSCRASKSPCIRPSAAPPASWWA